MSDTTEQDDEIVDAAEGAGPLLQRDYWGVLEDCPHSPTEVMAIVARRFVEFPPEEICTFSHAVEGDAPLEVGDELAVDIRMAGDFRVRVIHKDAASFTIATLRGHPEAGRITFGAYRNVRGDVIFHIRSRARAGSKVKYLGWLAAGDAMQTTTWTDFINNVAACAGAGIVGHIHAETEEVEETDADREATEPTFRAVAD